MAAIKVAEGANVSLSNVAVDGFDIGLEVDSASQVSLSNVRFNTNVADIAYEDGASIRIINSTAVKLLNLTEGDLSVVGSDMHHLAQQIIQTTDIQRLSYLLRRLHSLYNRVPTWIRAGIKYEVAWQLIKRGYQYLNTVAPELVG